MSDDGYLIPDQLIQPIVDAAFSAMLAFWNDNDEAQLRRHMVRLREMYTAVTILGREGVAL